MAKAIGVTAKLTANGKPVTEAAKKTGYKSIQHAGFSIAKMARESMTRARGPSPAGTPPHVHRGRLRRSIRVAIDRDEVLIGPSYARMKTGSYPPWMASMHERGGTFGVNRQGRTSLTKTGKRRKPAVYPARPFMAPALQKAISRFTEAFKGTI